MNIQSINAYNNSPSFSSKLVPNNTLRDAFDHARKTGDVKFLNSIKNILNDGKDNTVKIVSYRCPQNTDEYLKTSLFVNDMEKDFLDNQPLFTAKKNISTGNRITDSINCRVSQNKLGDNVSFVLFRDSCCQEECLFADIANAQ